MDLYCEKWKLEETPKQFIPNPLTFLNQERYYDEIIVDESKKDKFKKILQLIEKNSGGTSQLAISSIQRGKKSPIRRQATIRTYRLWRKGQSS